jgi:hypothetical protein
VIVYFAANVVVLRELRFLWSFVSLQRIGFPAPVWETPHLCDASKCSFFEPRCAKHTTGEVFKIPQCLPDLTGNLLRYITVLKEINIAEIWQALRYKG